MVLFLTRFLFSHRTSLLLHAAMIDLYYDWKGGRNANIVKSQQGKTGTLYDIEYNNQTSFYFNREKNTCKTITFSVGILRPNWLEGAEFLGEETVNTFECWKWTKADFITYWQDKKSGRPIRWRFFDGVQVEVMEWNEGRELGDEEWQAPKVCFEPQEKNAKNEKKSAGSSPLLLRDRRNDGTSFGVLSVISSALGWGGKQKFHLTEDESHQKRTENVVLQ
mmetsp:Transcript_10681/g.20697  ORF Transcript_10681/g.20697 Transcript_10681/m.20697 type:complete len:221 (+) Transcript_10681:717-1379(+)